MTEDRPTISTHVLDTSSGGPAAAVTVTLWRSLLDGSEEIAGQAITDSDGRVRDLLGGVPLDRGRYRIEFEIDDGGFFTGLSIAVRIEDPSRSYHVPLLRAPFGLSTYRGS